jgi:predicted membrane metal-binding protein
MDSNLIVQIAVIGTFALLGFGIATIIFSAAVGFARGKQDFKRIAIMATPFVVFGISYLILQGGELAFERAGVLTALVMMGIMAASVVITGLRGTFKF